MTSSAPTTRKQSGARHTWRWHELHLPPVVEQRHLETLLDVILSSHHLGPLVFETRATPSGIQFIVGTHPTKDTVVRRTLREHLPGCTLRTRRPQRSDVAETARVMLSHPTARLAGERVTAVCRAVFAAFAGVLHAPTATNTQEVLVLQVMIGIRRGPARPPQPTHHSGFLDLILGGTPPRSRDELRHDGKRTGKHVADVHIRVGAEAATPERRRSLLASLVNALRVVETSGARLRVKNEHPRKLTAGQRPWRYGLSLSREELIGVMGWPLGEDDIPGRPGLHPRLLPPAASFPTQSSELTPKANQRVIGKALALPEHPYVSLGIQAATQHTVLVGPTGSGKSACMLRMALADIHAGRSVLLVDPKSDLAHDVLQRIPEHRHQDVVVINPLDAHPVGLNPLASARRQPEVVADSILSSFKHVFADSWGVRTEDVLSTALLELARIPNTSLPMLPRLLTDAAYRTELFARHAHTRDALGTDQFWHAFNSQSAGMQAQILGPVLTKLRHLLLRPHLRAVLGQTTPGFTLDHLFTRRRIVIVALNKGILGAETARLLGSLLISSLWPLILERARLPEARRHIVSVYLDELQDFLTLPGDLGDALAQSRSLGVAWHLAHQYRDQLSSRMQAALDVNARNKVVFGLNAGDATAFAAMAPHLTRHDFMLQPRFAAYAHLLHDGTSSDWFTLQTLPPPPGHGNAPALMAASSQRYGQPAEATDAALAEGLPTTPTPDQTTPTGSATHTAPRSARTAPIGRKKRTS